ncbi:MAG TPA: penicillin-binding protein 1A [Steroidobacteraceae bacterium]|nr:penicillin-binding protein 1A [Steroidobacteraceae bacterium]
MQRPVGKLLATLLTAVLAIAGAVVLGIAGAFQFVEPDLPDAAELRDLRMQLPLTVYSRDGKLIAQIGEQRRIPVPRADMPPQLVDAFLAAEDDRFFEHPGVDWQGLVRALAANVSAGGVREGGGTITMQLARNTLLTPERTLRRKLKEVFLALSIEREFTKDEILTQYLNRIFLGQRAYGVGAAAEVYFGKKVGELTLGEAALIAGLPRSPSRDNPAASVARAHARRTYVLRRMAETGTIDEAAREAADSESISPRIHAPVVQVQAPYVAEMVRQEMLRRYGPSALTDGYAVTTTVDSVLQAAADSALWRAMLEYDRRHGYRGPAGRVDPAALDDAASVAAAFAQHPGQGSLHVAVVASVGLREARVRTRDGRAIDLDWDAVAWARPALPDAAVGPAPKSAGDVLAIGDIVFVEARGDGTYRLAQVPAVGAAFTALDPHDGAILALVGGFDFWASKYNRAVQAKRQPGSAFKPFLYSAALEHGFTPATLINDAPIVLPGGGGDDGTEEWRPQNITKKFYGPTPMREALVRSRNLVSIRLLRGTGLGPAMRHIGAFGFGPEAMPPNLTLALGTGQVTPLEMARGFSVFANGGWLVTPYFIASVDDASGTTVFQATPPLACPQCVDEPQVDAAASTADASPAASPPTPIVDGSAAIAAGGDQGLVPPERRATRAISAANAYIMTDIMTDVIQRGTAVRARSLGRRDIAGKTGTTSDHRDAWFAGFNADLAAVAWIGFDQERSLGDNEEGARAALPMWIYFMEQALQGRPEHRLPEPPGVVRMWVSRETGAPASAGSPDAIFEAFLERYVPQPGQSGYDVEGVDEESVQPSTDDSIF